MKKILVSVMVIALVAGLVGAGLSAYFSDTETSTGNVFQAGTLDLQVGAPGSEQDNPGVLVTFTNLKPCDSKDFEIGFKNVGSLTGQLTFSMTLADSDGTGTTEFPAEDVNADDFAKCLIVTAALYDRTQDGDYSDANEDVLAAWTQWGDLVNGDNDGKLSIYEMSQCSWTMTETLASGASTKVKVTIHFDDTEYVGDVNDLQAEGVAVTITGTLNQV